MNKQVMPTARYEEYKDSGVDWLGEIPAEWIVKPGMVAFSENKRNNKGMKEEQVLSLSYGNIIIKPKEKLVGLVPESFETYQIIEAGDIIIRGTDLQNDKTSLRTGLAKDEGIITSAYLSLRVCSNYSSRFLHYYLHTLDTTKVIYKFGTGLRQNLSFGDFKRLPVFEIPFQEQTAIAEFLDEKVAKIEALVGIKRRQIELLTERKQILIQNAVTKGINPDAPMKESGVDWIGSIPAHWEVKQIKHFATIRSGDGITNSELQNNGEYEVYGGNGLIGYSRRYNTSGEYFVIGRVGAYCGNVRISNTKKWISDNALILRLIDVIESEFLLRVLVAADLNKMNESNAQPLITGSKVMNLQFPLPPESEQPVIANFIRSIFKKIDSAINIKQNQITKLNEYKTTLINAAVTGKIKIA